jgi:hypothetical protein
MRTSATQKSEAPTAPVLTRAGEHAVKFPDAPVAVDTSYNGNTTVRHAALLASPPYARSSGHEPRTRLVQQLQAGYGNQHVGQVIARMRQTVGDAPKHSSALISAPAKPVVLLAAVAGVPQLGGRDVANAGAITRRAGAGAPAGGQELATDGFAGVAQQESGSALVSEEGGAWPQGVDEPSAPSSPEADEDFQEVVRQSQGVAEQERSHQPPAEKSQEAQHAAIPPANDVQSQAEGNQVSGKMAPASESPPKFNKEEFKKRLEERVQQITPHDMDETDKFKDSGKLASVKDYMTEQVHKQQDASQGLLKETTGQTPSTSGISEKPVTPLPSNDPGRAPGDIGGEKAAPKSQAYGDIEAPLQQSSKDLDLRLAAADIAEQQLANSNEPQFQAALASKKQAQADALEAPKVYRQFEEDKLSQARSDARGIAKESLQATHSERTESLGKVSGSQQVGKGKDESARKKIAGDLEEIYSQTKTKVEHILEDLDKEVYPEFDSGAADARRQFEDYVSKRVDDYKAARYHFPWDPIGWGLWLRDKLVGMPDEVNRFYEEGRDLYIKKMDDVIGKIAELVASRLNAAKVKVADGKKRIDAYLQQLPEDLKDIGAATAEDILGHFDELEQEISSKQDELVNRLANKYKENLDAIDARIKEMQEQNKGLIVKAIDFIVGVINTIVDLAKLLMTVLARAASAIPTILKDPIGFIRNLVDALKQGFQHFITNIKQYLMKGLMGWLTGSLASTGIQMPESLDEKGVFGLAVQVLGLTYATIRARAAQRIGEQKVMYLEQTFGMFKTLATQGVSGLWQVVTGKVDGSAGADTQGPSQFGDVKAMVLGPIEQFLVENVIRGGISWLLGLMSPASAFVKGCQAIVSIVQFFMDNAQRIAALINSIISAVLAIAGGAIDKAAKGVEDALANSIPLVIDFFAKLLGLGNVAQRVQEIVGKVRQPVEKAVDWVIDKGSKFARNMGGQTGGKVHTKGKGKAPSETKRHDADVKAGLEQIDKEQVRYVKHGRIAREDAVRVAATVKARYPVFKVLTVIDGGATWNYDYVASPGNEKQGPKKLDWPAELQHLISYAEKEISSDVQGALRRSARRNKIEDGLLDSPYNVASLLVPYNEENPGPKVLVADKSNQGLFAFNVAWLSSDRASYDRWWRWTKQVRGRVIVGAYELGESLFYWRNHLMTAHNNSAVEFLKIKRTGGELHERGLGPVIVKVKEVNEDGSFEKEYVVKPEERAIEQSLLGGQPTSLASELNRTLDTRIQTILMVTHKDYGSLIEFVEGIKPGSDGGKDMPVMSAELQDTIVFAWLTGLQDLHHENVIWKDGKPFLIDADNALNFREMMHGPVLQAGFTHYKEAAATSAMESRFDNAIIRHLLINAPQIRRAVSNAFRGREGRAVPFKTGTWGKGLLFYPLAEVGQPADELKTVKVTDLIIVPGKVSRWSIANDLARRVPDPTPDHEPGLRGETGVVNPEWFREGLEAAQIKTDFDKGQVPRYVYKFDSGCVEHNGKVVWRGRRADEAIANLLARITREDTFRRLNLRPTLRPAMTPLDQLRRRSARR